MMKSSMRKTREFAASVAGRVLGEAGLDRWYRLIRDSQHRGEDGWYVAKDGAWRRCRVVSTEWDDPIMAASGCSDEFYSDFFRRDMADGCPLCREFAAENAGEADFVARMGHF